MGCDIHHYEEVRSEDGDWASVQKLVKNEYYEQYPDEERPMVLDHYGYDDPRRLWRCYDLFAILANVRNGRGFAGCLTGAGFNSIVEPRGLPDDVSDVIKSESDSWGMDGHSHSWLTLKEILDYDWDQRTTNYGMLSWNEYEHWVKTRTEDQPSPMSYSGDVWGRDIKKVSVEQFEMWEKNPESRPQNPENYYARASWGISYRQAVGGRFWDYVEYLKTLGKPEDVRMVFWFDN